MDYARTRLTMARRESSRRAMSLLELTAVVAMLALLTLAGISRFGHGSLATGGTEGFSKTLSLALIHARRATISTGDNHYLQLSPASGNVTSFVLTRRTGSGDLEVDQIRTVPEGVTVTSTLKELEFDFDGTALTFYSVSIAGPVRSWSVTVVPLTGAVEATETTP
jgi:type II secretory pathway pseudopilin PulG